LRRTICSCAPVPFRGVRDSVGGHTRRARDERRLADAAILRPSDNKCVQPDRRRGVSTRFCKPRAHPRWRAVKSISPNLVSTNWHATSHGVTIEALLCWWFVARVIALSILAVHELTATALRRGRVGSVRSPTLDRGSPVVYGIGGS